MDNNELIIKEAEAMDFTEDELEKAGWGRICSGLTLELAKSMQKTKISSMIIKDDLNIGEYILMQKGIKYEYGEPEAEEKQDTVRETSGQIPNPDDPLLF